MESKGVISREELNEYLFDLYQEIKKSNCNSYLLVNLYIVGGAAMVINTDIRSSTMDIDTYIRSTVDLSVAIQTVARKYKLPIDWLNDNVKVTVSFTEKILDYCYLYKEFGGEFFIYVLNNLGQLCMKAVSFRVDSSDVTDIKGIIESNKDITYDSFMASIMDIYDDDCVLSVDAQLYIYNAISGRSGINENKWGALSNAILNA